MVNINSLLIGFGSGNNRKVLLPPLSVTASSGELVSIIGANGIGKSTLLRTLAGLQESAGGSIKYNGKDLHSFTDNELARLTGYISTEQVRVSNMTVFYLIALGRFPHTNWIGTLTSHDLEIIRMAMQQTSLLDYSDKYVSELSDGERQRAMIARVIAQDSEVFLMDEPTSFLDIRNKFEVIHLLHTLAHKNGKTIILSTHDFETALKHSDKIWLLLNDGIIEGSPEDLMINGMFDHLFESAVVRFNSADGTFTFRDNPGQTVYIEGDPDLCFWTEKALIRIGFKVSLVKGPLVVRITPEKRWILFSGDDRKEYSSVYELTRKMAQLKYLR